MPARYIMIEVTKGEPLPNDEEAIEVYGISYKSMDNVLGEDGGSNLLMDKAFKIIYGFNTNSSNSIVQKRSKKQQSMMM